MYMMNSLVEIWTCHPDSYKVESNDRNRGEFMRSTYQSFYINHMLLAILLLMILDYILTFIGINQLCYIIEANPINRFLFDLPFTYGISIRCLQSLIPVSMLFSVKNKVRSNIFFKILLGLILLEVCVLFLHINWITNYCISFLY